MARLQPRVDVLSSNGVRRAAIRTQPEMPILDLRKL